MDDNAIVICAQYKDFPYQTRRLVYSRLDADIAAATFAHLKGDEGREYSRVWWFKTWQAFKQESR